MNVPIGRRMWNQVSEWTEWVLPAQALTTQTCTMLTPDTMLTTDICTQLRYKSRNLLLLTERYCLHAPPSIVVLLSKGCMSTLWLLVLIRFGFIKPKAFPGLCRALGVCSAIPVQHSLAYLSAKRDSLSSKILPKDVLCQNWLNITHWTQYIATQLVATQECMGDPW